MKYQIVVDNDPFSMAKRVNKLCSKGWEPLGAPFVLSNGETWYHYQAMIHKPKEWICQNCGAKVKTILCGDCSDEEGKMIAGV